MYFLIYISAATELLTDAELKQILVKSRKNNERAGVTGMLLYHDGSFIQMLEGEKSVVEAFYNKIKNDIRHHSIHKLLDGNMDKRNFPDWSMGFKAISKDDFATIDGFKNIKEENLSGQDYANNKAMILFRSFINTNIL